jgi:hypothetical protein
LKSVVHCKKEPFDVYIGRPSKWGNPFVIGKDGSRADVIKKYKDYLENNEFLHGDIPELIGKTLGCWCAPLPCHGDILAEKAAHWNDVIKISLKFEEPTQPELTNFVHHPGNSL